MPEQRKRTPRPKLEWHLICITRLGKVSMLRDLDLFTARETYKRLRPEEHPEEWDIRKCLRTGEKPTSWHGGFVMGSMGRSYGPHDDWLEKVEVVGPHGVKLDPWHGVPPHIRVMRCQCGCEEDAIRFRVGETKTVRIEECLTLEEKQRRDLYRDVPTAFWLAPSDDVGTDRADSAGDCVDYSSERASPVRKRRAHHPFARPAEEAKSRPIRVSSRAWTG